MLELQEILEALKECNFYNLTSESYYADVIIPFKEKYKKDFSYDSGASKLALIFKKYNYVIKIPFCGSSVNSQNSSYDENDNNEECFSFYNAGGYSNGWDYCSVEAELYKEAKAIGIEKCFAKTEKIADINNYPIYQQEYVHIYNNYDISSNHTEKDIEAVISTCKSNNFDCFNKDWLSDVFCYFGEKIFYKFMDFISYMEINDLHNGNIGYINFRPVLMDYSGWND